MISIQQNYPRPNRELEVIPHCILFEELRYYLEDTGLEQQDYYFEYNNSNGHVGVNLYLKGDICIQIYWWNKIEYMRGSTMGIQYLD